jgi:hypothetical protein
MRTNPFYDSWLFLIGSTDDHHKLGALGYVFVVLFLALLVATLWIAATNWRQDPSQRTGTHVARKDRRQGSFWISARLSSRSTSVVLLSHRRRD